MKDLVIALLNVLGLGINAMVMSKDAFVERLKEYLNMDEIAVVDDSDNILIVAINTGNDGVTIEYTFDGTRVSKIDVY